jgi:DNA gyrase subunit A
MTDPSQPDSNEVPTPEGEASAPRDRVVDLEIDRELHDSYLTYAMSTIMDRALPDVRDGLKPSQRRILVAMNDLNLSPGRKHIKCAKIAGDTSGNYHPHGESVIYPTLVNLGQWWKTRYLLVDKQGNFGSIEGDPPAAMRYTEARMTAVATQLLEDLDQDTVDFKPNYDERLEEPMVLPGKFPNLLCNGSSGIAVGMASSIPPHNAAEICRAIVATIDDPQIGLDRLLEIVPGPDFPTGGRIMGRRGIAEAYATGRGRVIVRGRVHRDKVGGRDAIVIDEIPYQVDQSNLIEKIVDAAKSGRIPDISEVRNHSGRDAATRILVVLKRGGDPEVVERQLYEFTPLQHTFSIINIALVNSQPRTLSFKQIVQSHIDHRREVIRRRTEFQLRQARQQAHRLEGLVLAVLDLDEVIAAIRSSESREEAIAKLMRLRFRIPADHPRAGEIPQRLRDLAAQGDGVALTRPQAEAIGALRLIQLTGLEIARLLKELNELTAEIARLEEILENPAVLMGIVRADAEEIGRRFGDERRTSIEENEAEDFVIGDLIPEHPVAVSVSHAGYIKRLPLDTYRTQGRGGTGVKGGEIHEDDYLEHLLVCSSHDDLLCFTNTGRVFKIKVFQLPELSRTSRGRAIVNLLELRDGERIRAFLPVADFEKGEHYLFFATAKGRVKRSALKDYRNVNRSGIIAILLQEADRLIDVLLTSGEDHVLLASASGMAIRFDENDARVMGRSAAGVRGMDLREGDEIVGVVRCDEGADLLTVTERGYGKRTPLSEYLVQSEDGSSRPQSRGGKGRIDIRTTERNGSVASVRCVVEGDGLMLVSEGGMVVRIAVDTVSRIGRNTQGVRVARVKDGDRLVATARIEATLMADEETEAPPAEEPSTDETPASGDAPASDEPSAGGTPTA